MRHVTAARVLGLVLMIACAVSANWLLTDPSFRLDRPQVSGDLRYTSVAELLAAASIPPDAHPNIARLRTGAIRDALLALPAISDAAVDVTLPNRLAISVSERTPAFALEHAGAMVLVDATGQVLAGSDQATVSRLGLPLVDDARVTTPADAYRPGTTLDPIDLAAIVQLGAVTPALINSRASAMTLEIDDDDGFVMTAQPQGWRAVFGQYTPNLRPTDIIPRQVQCLRSLVDAYETKLQTVYLAPLDERCGTYLPVATPLAPTPAPTKSR